MFSNGNQINFEIIQNDMITNPAGQEDGKNKGVFRD